nr:hypothetical protein [Burkholderia lata]
MKYSLLIHRFRDLLRHASADACRQEYGKTSHAGLRNFSSGAGFSLIRFIRAHGDQPHILTDLVDLNETEHRTFAYRSSRRQRRQVATRPDQARRNVYQQFIHEARSNQRAVEVAAGPDVQFVDAFLPQLADQYLQIDVGYVRHARCNRKGSSKQNRIEAGIRSSSIAVVVAALAESGKPPRVRASAMPRTKRLNQEMTRFLEDSGCGDPNEVVVLTDGARDLAGVANNLPYDNEWVLDWAHIGRMMRRVDQAIAPLAYGRLTDGGSAFELWDLFVRFRHYVWVGRTFAWQQLAARLARLLA